ncbi:MAG: heme exporter protein CcmD [Cocleimonas sp.]
MSELFGNYAPFILGAMGAAVVLMLLEPILLISKRRSALQEIKRFKRLEERQQPS